MYMKRDMYVYEKRHVTEDLWTLKHASALMLQSVAAYSAAGVCTSIESHARNDVAVCCSVLQCVAVCYSVLLCVAVCCSVL